LLAILVPFANWKGAAVGMIVSHIVTIVVTYGHLMIKKPLEFLETSIEGCTDQSFSSDIMKPNSAMYFLKEQKPVLLSRWMENVTTTAAPVAEPDYSHFPQNIFAVSYMYYSLFGTLITVLVGMIVSLLTRSKADAYDAKYIHPAVYRFTKLFSGSESLFSDEKLTSDIKTSSLKETKPPMEQVNAAFESEEPCSSGCETNSVKFKANLIYTSDRFPVESYKKLSEDSKNLP